MGAGSSSLLVEEIDDLGTKYNLTGDEVQRLYQRFQKLDRGERGKLSVDSLMMIPELAMNPLAERIASLFEDANFEDFVQLVSVFGERAKPELKRLFLFRVYDFDDDGFISQHDLTTVVRVLLGEDNVSEAQLEQLVRSIIANADADGDGIISKEEFEAVVSLDHVKRRCTVTL